MSEVSTEQPIVGDFTSVSAFQSSTGKIHLKEDRRWGAGVACTDRFMLGTPLTTQAMNVDCLRCRPRMDADS